MQDSYWSRSSRRSLARRRFLGGAIAAGAGIAGGAVAGCGDDDSSGSKPSAAATSVAGSTASAGSPAASGKREPKGDLKLALITLGDQSADPHLQTGGGNCAMITSCFEQFSRWSKDGKLIPALASKVEEPPDHSKLIFTLREDATFWDGTPVTSADAKWSYERYIGLPPGDPYAPLVKKEVKSVETPDARTVVVNIAVPTVARLTRGTIAAQGWNIGSQAYYSKVGEDTFKKQPMATGPFKLLANEIQQLQKLEAYPGHYERVPYFKNLEIDLVTEQTTRLARLKTGEADYIDSVVGPARKDIESDSQLRLFVTEATGLAVLFFQNMPKDPFTDVRVRRALRLAIDQDSLIKGLLNGAGTKAPGVNIYPVTIGWDPQKLPAQEFNLEKAKASLAEAGLAGGFKTKLWSYSSNGAPLIPEMAEAIAGMWKKIGVDTALETPEAAAYLEKYRAHTLDGIAPLGTAANLAADFSLKYYLPTDTYGSNSPADIVEKIQKLGVEFDQAKYLALAQEIYTEINDQVLSMTMPFANATWAVRKAKISGWTPNAGNPFPNGLETLIPA